MINKCKKDAPLTKLSRPFEMTKDKNYPKENNMLPLILQIKVIIIVAVLRRII